MHRFKCLLNPFAALLTALMPFVLGCGSAQAGPLSITTAVYNNSTHKLTVKTHVKGVSGTLILLHGQGGILGQASTGTTRKFSIPLAQFGEVPCQVEAQLGNLSVSRKVAGAPAACGKIPICKILSPAPGAALKINTDVAFSAEAKLKDKKAEPLTYEWDFGGGAMGEVVPGTNPVAYKRPTAPSTTVQFVRDNSRYRVRFAATDAKKRRCESTVDVNVGNPPAAPSGVAAMVGQSLAQAPKRGAGLKNDLVVLPFQEWSMQQAQDGVVFRNLDFAPQDWLLNNLNAYVIQKGSVGAEGPKFMTAEEVDLVYSAATNPFDPVGANSINSTSQNWPLSADITMFSPLLTSAIQKSDLWETPIRTPSDQYGVAKQYKAISWAANYYDWSYNYQAGDNGLPKVDEGYFPYFTLNYANYDFSTTRVGWSSTDQQAFYEDEKNIVTNILARKPASITHGTYMPGVNNPYVTNDPQTYSLFDTSNQWFVVQTLPISDVDDAGRVNPQPLVRIDASKIGAVTTAARVDATVSNSRDLHCRECHAKGKIAANPNVVMAPSQYDPGDGSGVSPVLPPVFYDINDLAIANPDSHVDPHSQNLFDLEWAANINALSSHAYYSTWMMSGGGYYMDVTLNGFLEPLLSNGQKVYSLDGPQICSACHVTEINKPQINEKLITAFTDMEFGPCATVGGCDGASYSQTMHNFHGRMQYNADKSDILRDANGAHLKFDPSTVSARLVNADPNPKTLFPIFGPDGKQLPMEQNCLRCHAGHREPLFNDRMFTAGKTCYDCHGDMLAVGKAFPKDASKLGSKLVGDYRFPWMDEPDCGSCHAGNGNLGRNTVNGVGPEATQGFFSAGVKQRAFEDTDLAATTRKVDKSDPDAVRFAVVPDHDYQYLDTSSTSTTTDPIQVSMPVYRYGKDAHGGLACAACHGASHSIGPNRDPKSNENVTALQLQGYAGPILECKVCHTADAFAQLASLDGGPTSGLPADSGILGGPHNMHPMNDPNWWSRATADKTPISDGTHFGGWHDNVYHQPGLKGEDQCAACHGADHKGTRLSKTPVDLEFTVKNGKKAKWKAGEFVGCDRCHSLKASFRGKPGGTSGNHDPVITSTPVTSGIIGQDYRYEVAANDPDGDPLTYRLSNAPGSVSLDKSGVVTASWPASLFSIYQSLPAVLYTVNVSDGKGGQTSQTVTVKLDCPAKQSWLWDTKTASGSCVVTSAGATITPHIPDANVVSGGTYTQTVIATDDQGLPLTFSLTDQPTTPAPGMTIAPDPGAPATQAVITWVTDTATSGKFTFKVTATDAQGGNGFQYVTVYVCPTGTSWMNGMGGMCM